MLVKASSAVLRFSGGDPSGSLPKQFGTVVRKIIRLAVPPRTTAASSRKDAT
jgi:hypothetical protein